MPAPFVHPGPLIDQDILGWVNSFDPSGGAISDLKRWASRGEWRADTFDVELAKKLTARSLERLKQAIHGQPTVGLVGRVIDTLQDLFVRAIQDQAKPAAATQQFGRYETAEAIRLALLKINSIYPDNNRKSDLVLALYGLQQLNANACGDLLWADNLSTNQPHALRGWFEDNYVLDWYLPLLDGVEAFVQNTLQPWLNTLPSPPRPPAVTIASLRDAFNQKVRAKLRYYDLLLADMTHADLKWALYAVVAESFSPLTGQAALALTEHLIAPLSLKNICLLIAYIFRQDTNKPYRYLREGGYRLAQAILRMVRGQATHNFQDAVFVNAARDLEHFVLNLRSNFYPDDLVQAQLNLLVPHANITAQQLAQTIDSLETQTTQRAHQTLITFATNALQVRNAILQPLLNVLPTRTDERSKMAVKVLRVAEFDWFNNLDRNSEGAKLVFTEFLRIFGFRALQAPELVATDDIEKTLAFQQVLAQLQELSQRGNLQGYLNGLSNIAFALPTANKPLEELTYIESTLETLKQLLDTINNPPLDGTGNPRYRRYRTNAGPASRVSPQVNNINPVAPAHNHLLQNYPFIVIDQSDTRNQALWNQNGHYLQTLAGRLNASIHHISMSQVMQFAKDLYVAGIAEMFATTVHRDNAYWQGAGSVNQPPEAGYGGARNIVFLVATVLHRALKQPNQGVQNMGQLIAKTRQQREALLWNTIHSNLQVMMGDDDLTVLPGFAHAKVLLANRLQGGYWKILTRMMGRATTRLPNAASKISEFSQERGLSRYFWNVLQTMLATKFIYSWVRGDGFVWHGFAGVVMHLGSCLDLPLPTEEKLFATFYDFQDVLGLSIHHSGDRYDPPQRKMPAMAEYLAQTRVAAALINADKAPNPPAPYVLHWNRTLKGDDSFRTLARIYRWIARDQNQHISKQGMFWGLFMEYLENKFYSDTMLSDNPATLFGSLRTRLPELASRPEMTVLNQEITQSQAGYTNLWNDVQLANTYRNLLWNQLVITFKNIPVGNQNPLWITIRNRIGNTPMIDRVPANMDVINWLVEHNVPLDGAIAVIKAHPAMATGNRLEQSKVAKSVYLTTVSLGEGRFFTLLLRMAQTNPQGVAVPLSLFPDLSGEFSAPLSDEPVLINGMKVIFDQPVPVQPVKLQRKNEVPSGH